MGTSKKTGAKDAPPPEEESFDTILSKLQAIVERLEQEDLGLEGSLKAFEEGMALSQRGQKILDAAERRVEVLLQDGSTEPLPTTR